MAQEVAAELRARDGFLSRDTVNTSIERATAADLVPKEAPPLPLSQR
jgi:hypothetical protein